MLALPIRTHNQHMLHTSQYRTSTLQCSCLFATATLPLLAFWSPISTDGIARVVVIDDDDNAGIHCLCVHQSVFYCERRGLAASLCLILLFLLHYASSVILSFLFLSSRFPVPVRCFSSQIHSADSSTVDSTRHMQAVVAGSCCRARCGCAGRVCATHTAPLSALPHVHPSPPSTNSFDFDAPPESVSSSFLTAVFLACARSEPESVLHACHVSPSDSLRPASSPSPSAFFDLRPSSPSPSPPKSSFLARRPRASVPPHPHARARPRSCALRSRPPS